MLITRSLLNFWPLTISTVWSASPIAIGWRGLPVACATAFGAIFWNALLSVWTSGIRYILFLAALMLTAFGGSLASMSPDNEYQSVALASFAAFGLGGVIVPAATAAMIACPDALITTCAALSLSVRAVGGAIGYSIYYSVFVKKLTEVLPVKVGTYAVQAGLPVQSAEVFVGTFLTAPTEITAVPGVTPGILAQAAYGAQWAYAEALHLVWYVNFSLRIHRIQLTEAQVRQYRFRLLRHGLRAVHSKHEEVPDKQNRCGLVRSARCAVDQPANIVIIAVICIPTLRGIQASFVV